MICQNDILDVKLLTTRFEVRRGLEKQKLSYVMKNVFFRTVIQLKPQQWPAPSCAAQVGW